MKKMGLPKVGMITFSDAREHEYKVLYEEKTAARIKRTVEYFADYEMELHTFDTVARSPQDIDRQTDELKKKGVEVFIANIPCWTWPNGVVRGVLNMGLPTILLSNDDPGTHGTVGFLGSGGALNQIGYKHLRIQQDFTDEHPNLFDTKMMPYIRAAAAVRKLQGRIFGFIGGRSLGIDTGSFDPMQWKKLFQIDSDHIDHEEIVRRAEAIDESRVEAVFKWLVDSVGSVKYDEKLTEERLKYQVACYLATKDIIADRHLDFGAIKCMPDMTNFRAPQCISTALLNGGYDADGEFDPFPISCEADADGPDHGDVKTYLRGNAHHVRGCEPCGIQGKAYIPSKLRFHVHLLCGPVLRRMQEHEEHRAAQGKQAFRGSCHLYRAERGRDDHGKALQGGWKVSDVYY